METTKTENTGLRLLKARPKGIWRVIFSPMLVILFLLALQFLTLFGMFFRFQQFLPHILGGTGLFTAAMVLYLLNTDLDPTAKITWMAVIMVLPVFGSLLYLYSRRDIGHRALRKRLQELQDQAVGILPQDSTTMEELKGRCPGAAAMTRYAASAGCHPVLQNTTVTYFPSGEAKLEAMLRELEKAEKFIFLEYFIIEEGMMWGRILEILARKAAQGVDVRVMYDGTCEFTLLPKSYPQKLRALGIQCRVFAPVTPFASTHYNYRDHRKILVIDGHTAFNGGVNLADEYVNHIQKYGHWKDAALMLKGEAARSFTLMFLQMWDIPSRKVQWESFLSEPVEKADTEGFVMPYGDRPLDDKRVGQQVYMDLLNRAEKYVHIMTPYLVLDGEMENALRYAAQRGVEVKLILPGIPDMPPVHALAKTHYKSLLDAGVRIYEYTPGYVHAKVFVCDGTEAVVGTINLDYRSLYHHFECATYLYGVGCIADIERDFQQTAEKCRTVTLESVKKEKLLTKLMGFVLKVIAPLM